MPGILLLSGLIGSGKTALADTLEKKDGFFRCRTSEFLQTRLNATGQNLGRRDLQNFSDKLDRETDYRWVFEDALKQLGQSPEPRVIIDAIRKPEQIKVFREHYS